MQCDVILSVSSVCEVIDVLSMYILIYIDMIMSAGVELEISFTGHQFASDNLSRPKKEIPKREEH